MCDHYPCCAPSAATVFVVHKYSVSKFEVSILCDSSVVQGDSNSKFEVQLVRVGGLGLRR